MSSTRHPRFRTMKALTVTDWDIHSDICSTPQLIPSARLVRSTISFHSVTSNIIRRLYNRNTSSMI